MAKVNLKNGVEDEGGDDSETLSKEPKYLDKNVVAQVMEEVVNEI